MNSMYDILLQLPLFQGISRKDLSTILEKTKFHFLKYRAGESIVRRNEECTYMKFIISGSVRAEMVNKSGKIRVSETLHAPNILFPNHLFGRNTVYPCDVWACDSCGIMQVDKPTFITLIQKNPVIIINLLNILSRRSQKSIETFLSLSSGSIKERLAFWILSFTQRNATDVQILCKQKDLYTFFGVQRSLFISALNELSDEGIITYTPQSILLLDRQKLRDILSHDDPEE